MENIFTNETKQYRNLEAWNPVGIDRSHHTKSHRCLFTLNLFTVKVTSSFYQYNKIVLCSQVNGFLSGLMDECHVSPVDVCGTVGRSTLGILCQLVVRPWKSFKTNSSDSSFVMKDNK